MANGLGFWGGVLAVLTCLAFLLLHSAATIFFTVVIFYFLWLAVRNSPTVRTRRFVLSAAMDGVLLLWTYSFFERFFLNGIVLGHWGPRIDLAAWFGINLPFEAAAVLFGGLPVFLVFSSFVLYVVLRWGQLLYEDLGGTVAGHSKDEPIETSENALKNELEDESEKAEPSMWAGVFEKELNYWFRIRQGVRRLQESFLTDEGLRRKQIVCQIAVAVFLFVFVAQGIRQGMLMFALFGKDYSLSMLYWYWGSTAWFYLLQVVIQVVFFHLVWKGRALAKDETAVEKTPSVMPIVRWKAEAYSPDGRRRIFKDAAFLLAAGPLLLMLWYVVWGYARQIVWEPVVREVGAYPVPLYFNTIHSVVEIMIVLIVSAALWISSRRERRFSAFSVVFLVCGLITFLFIEWEPLFHGSLLLPLQKFVFWWVPAAEKESFAHGAPLSSNYFYWHVFAVGWLVYSLFAAGCCYLLNFFHNRSV